MMQTHQHFGIPTRRRILPAVISLILAGGMGNAQALELGDAKVRSAIGEKLIVEIPVRNNTLADKACFIPTLSGAPNLGNIRTQLRGDSLVLRSNRLIREPMLDLRISVNCPNVPRMLRDYTLFIDPAQRMTENQRQLSTPEQTFVRPSVAQRRRTAPTPVARNIDSSAGYLVQRGDSVSAIAMRIKTADQDMWAVVDDIVAANPDAFVNGNADVMLAGAMLALPAYATTAALATSTTTPSPTPVAAVPDVTPPTPNAPTPVAKISAEPDTISTSEQTQALLSVLSDRSNAAPAVTPASTTTVAAATDSPFKTLEPIDIETAAPVPLVSAPEPALNSNSWLDRLVTMFIGMAGAIALWMLWQIVAGASARKRRTAANATIPVRPVRPVAPNARLSTSQDATPWRAPVNPDHKREEGIEVTRLDLDFGAAPSEVIEAVDFNLNDTVEMLAEDNEAQPVFDASVYTDNTVEQTAPQKAAESTFGSGELAALDDETQKLLEQDYEEQLTRTQRLSKALAAKALGIPAADSDRTAQLPMLDEDPYFDDDLTLNEAVTIESPEPTTADDLDITITANMALDFDFDVEDLDEVSGLLRSATDDLTDSYQAVADDDFEEELDDGKTEKLVSRASSS